MWIIFSLNLELQDDRGFTPLWLSLTDNECFDPDDEDSFGAKLVSHGASTDTLHETTGMSLVLMISTDTETILKEGSERFLRKKSTRTYKTHHKSIARRQPSTHI